MSLRARIHELLEDEERLGPAARTVRGGLMALILLSVGSAVLATEPDLPPPVRDLLEAIEAFCVAVFTVEYVLRVWTSVEDRAGRYGAPLAGRLRYMATPMALVDLAAVLPFYLTLLLPVDLVFLRLLRLLRILKITRYSPALSTLQLILYNERRSLLSALLLLAVLVVLAAGFMNMAEGDIQPAVFGSIPRAMWWAIITLTTVGYGDAAPVTSLGRIIAGITALCGIGTLALPTAILGAGFAREMQKKEFFARSSMVARVPLLRHLPPAQLAEVTSLLHARMLPPRYTVLRRGEHAEAMYFIGEGRVVVRLGDRRLTLGPGSFFGELALIEGRPREITVTTLTPCRLLELDAGDFHRLIAGDPGLRETILAEARETARRHGFTLHVERDGAPAAPADQPPAR
ncbi:cyclic nucleotide-gated ion channel [Marinimicrococcus flavescens]|uniref:Cyclic nucleotide-gated ion channel n=1 Tax=Marinimicrococcus flavescens TaxID=3031815 RepID=A0AAP4D6K4_9PROT|nr:cyclic nucleotide-gated ion channel [Marinimicrococcus flavescens]